MNEGIKYIPLTFVTAAPEKERLIRNTILLRHFMAEAEGSVTLSHYIDGTQYGFNAPASESGTNKYVRISDISNGEIAWNSVPFCQCDDPETYLLSNDDIIVARTGGTTGKSYMVSSPPSGAIFAGYLIRVRANSKTNPLFVSVFFNSYLYWSQVTSLNRDEFRPSVNAEKLKALRLPMFSRDVQDRIVSLSNDPEVGAESSIQSEMCTVLTKRGIQVTVVEEITHQETLLAKLKQAILQEAIAGKLTADWRAAHPDVEPASQLLQRIQAEKARLIAAKKLRPEKPLPKITPADIPFEIPQGWCWCRLDDFLNVRAGIAKGGKHYKEPTTPTPYLRVANVQRAYLDLDEIKYLDLPTSEVIKYALEDGDLLVTEGGDPDKVGRCAVWRNEIEGCVHQNHIFSMRPYADGSLELEFVPLMLNSPFCQAHFLGSYKQTTNLASINKTVLRSTRIPLPPLAEQAAIVARVETLMGHCRALSAEIEHARTHAAQLLQAVLKEAFAPAA